jgi:hypothetical protein
MDKKILVIDGNNFSDFEGLVREFNICVFSDKEPTAFHRTWGGGFGQFNDLLRGGYGTPEGQFTIHWINSHKSKEDLQYKATLAWLEVRRDKVHPANKERWLGRIELMKYNIGETLFEMIVAIIVSHENITLTLD